MCRSAACVCGRWGKRWAHVQGLLQSRVLPGLQRCKHNAWAKSLGMVHTCKVCCTAACWRCRLRARSLFRTQSRCGQIVWAEGGHVWEDRLGQKVYTCGRTGLGVAAYDAQSYCMNRGADCQWARGEPRFSLALISGTWLLSPCDVFHLDPILLRSPLLPLRPHLPPCLVPIALAQANILLAQGATFFQRHLKFKMARVTDVSAGTC